MSRSFSICCKIKIQKKSLSKLCKIIESRQLSRQIFCNSSRTNSIRNSWVIWSSEILICLKWGKVVGRNEGVDGRKREIPTNVRGEFEAREEWFIRREARAPLWPPLMPSHISYTVHSWRQLLRSERTNTQHMDPSLPRHFKTRFKHVNIPRKHSIKK